MATLTTTKKAYRGGITPLGDCVGYESAPKRASVMRYQFTTDGQGATTISFKTSRASLAYYADGDTNAGDDIANVRFSVTDTATGFENYVGSAGTKCKYKYGEYFYGELEIELLPNRDYYLWLYPNFRSFAVFNAGNCTVETSGQYGTPSTITANDGELGQNIPITLTRGLAEMLHTVKVECAGITETLVENSTEYPTIVWHPTLEKYAPAITQSDAAAVTIRVETFLNGNSLGESTKTINVKIPSGALLPQVSDGWATAAPYNTGVASGFTVYINTYSQAKVTFDSSKIDMSASLGGSIKGFEISCKGKTVSQAPFLTPVLDGQADIVCAVIDSRGRRVKKTITITPLAYATPKITNVSIERCDANGNVIDDGYYFKATATAIYSSLGGENTYTLTCAFKTLQGSYGNTTNMASGAPQIVYGTSPDASYEVQIKLTDKLSNTTSYTKKLPTRQWAMKFREDAQGVAFGKAPEFTKAMELPEDWTIRRGVSEQVVWGANGKVTRSKLANDALYSPIVDGVVNRNLTIAELGRTIKGSWNAAVTLTLTQADSATMPNGAEFAVMRYGTSGGNDVTITGDGTRFVINGDDTVHISAAIKITDAFGMIAIKKLQANASNGDLWLVTGNVEVVS